MYKKPNDICGLYLLFVYYIILILSIIFLILKCDSLNLNAVQVNQKHVLIKQCLSTNTVLFIE